MNPSAFENENAAQQFNFERVNEGEEALNEQEKERILEQAELFKNSSILKSYELLIQKYELEFDVKNSQLKDFERQLQIIQVENSNLAQQVFQFKTNTLNQNQEGHGQKATIESDINKLFGRDERDHLMELLKRNHDVMVDKYEEQRQRNEMLEKTAIEKERLYHEIKNENDQLANQSYKMQRGIEELANEKRILETKLKNCEAILR